MPERHHITNLVRGRNHGPFGDRIREIKTIYVVLITTGHPKVSIWENTARGRDAKGGGEMSIAYPFDIPQRRARQAAYLDVWAFELNVPLRFHW